MLYAARNLYLIIYHYKHYNPSQSVTIRIPECLVRRTLEALSRDSGILIDDMTKEVNMFKHDYSVQDKVRTLIDDIDHQGIGGKEICLEFSLSRDEVAYLAIAEGNWACKNFIDRRIDFDKDFEPKLFYGKVDNLGYIVADDEFKA